MTDENSGRESVMRVKRIMTVPDGTLILQLRVDLFNTSHIAIYTAGMDLNVIADISRLRFLGTTM